MCADITKTLQKLKAFGFSPSNIVDCGGHHGNWTRTCKSIFPNAIYHIFEPIHYTQLDQLRNQHPPHTIHISNTLLYHSVTEVDWYEEQNTGDSIYKENTSHFAHTLATKRQTSTLDIELDTNKRYEMIKIDCQGAELDILKGGCAVLKHTDVVLLELPFVGQYNMGAPSFLEHIQFMNDIGFVPFDICELHLAKNVLIQIDICFVRRDGDICQKVQSVIESL
eukprot:1188975-Prorocentrum_minimum.AAC.2